MTCFDKEPDHQPTKEEWEAYETKTPMTELDSTRYIPTAEAPPEQTNASLRALLREAHERERHLQNRLQAILLVYKNNDVAGIDMMAQIAIDALTGIDRFKELLSQFGGKSHGLR